MCSLALFNHSFTNRFSENLGGVTFLTIPNELKLPIADKLHISDINSLASTSLGFDSLLTRYKYRRGLVETSRRGTAYPHCALECRSGAGARKFIDLCAEINMPILEGKGRRLRTDVEPYDRNDWGEKVAPGMFDPLGNNLITYLGLWHCALA